MQSAVSVIINPPAQKRVALSGGAFVSRWPVLVEFSANRREFFDRATGDLVGFVDLTSRDSLLPKHVAARFGGHARGEIQLALEQKARRCGWMGAIQLASLGFDFFESRFKILSRNSGVELQAVFAPDLAVGWRRRSQSGSDRRAVEG